MSSTAPDPLSVARPDDFPGNGREWRRTVQYRKATTARRQAARDATRDPEAVTPQQKQARIDLGLAIFHSHALPGVSYSYEEIAAWAGCTDGAIARIERQALKKLANSLWRDPALREAVEDVIGRVINLNTLTEN